MSNNIQGYIKVLDDFATELKANISMLKDTTIRDWQVGRWSPCW